MTKIKRGSVVRVAGVGNVTVTDCDGKVFWFEVEQEDGDEPETRWAYVSQAKAVR